MASQGETKTLTHGRKVPGTYKTAVHFSLHPTSHHGDAYSCSFRPYRPSVLKGRHC